MTVAFLISLLFLIIERTSHLGSPDDFSVTSYFLFYFGMAVYLTRRLCLTPANPVRKNAYFWSTSGPVLPAALALIVAKNCHWLLSNPRFPLRQGQGLSQFFQGANVAALSVSIAILAAILLRLLVNLGQQRKARRNGYAGTHPSKKTSAILRSFTTDPWIGRASALVIVLLSLNQISVPLISPTPFIDVQVSNTEAVDFFLSGLNPYSQRYVDIYNGLYDYKPGFLYSPGILFLAAPFRAFLGDIRYLYIAANLATAAFLFLLCRRFQLRATLCWLITTAWISMPEIYHILDQSWIDPVLATCAVGLALAIDSKRWLAAGVLAAVATVCKQTGFIIAIFGLFRVWQLAPRQLFVRSFGISAAIVSAVILPFALLDWNGFYAMVIHSQISAQIRSDSINMTAVLLRHGVRLAGWVQALAVIVGIAWGFAVLRKDRSRSLTSFALALWVSYGLAFFLGKFAFRQYHHLLASFVLLVLIDWARPSENEILDPNRKEMGIQP